MISYPKLKHILTEKWSGVDSLSADLSEEFVMQTPEQRIQVHGQGRIGFRRRHNAHSWIRQTRTRTQLAGPPPQSSDALVFTVYDGKHVYEQQEVAGRKFVYIYPSDHKSVRMTMPCILFFKFLERRGIVEECSEETINAIPYYLIGLEVLQGEEKGVKPALEVFYVNQETGLLSFERLFNQDRREIGRRMYSNFNINQDQAEEHYVYTKPGDVVALPLE